MFAPLARLLGLYSIKEELEVLSFKYSDPEAYALMQRRLDALAREQEDVILKVLHICMRLHMWPLCIPCPCLLVASFSFPSGHHILNLHSFSISVCAACQQRWMLILHTCSIGQANGQPYGCVAVLLQARAELQDRLEGDAFLQGRIGSVSVGAHQKNMYSVYRCVSICIIL